MKLRLPHLPNNIDLIVWSYLKEFIIIPQHIINGLFSSVKISNGPPMNNPSKNKNSKALSNKPIDLKTIFGVIRNKYVCSELFNVIYYVRFYSCFFSPLISRDLQLVKNLVQERGENIVNEFDEEGFTPIHWVIFSSKGLSEAIARLFGFSVSCAPFEW